MRNQEEAFRCKYCGGFFIDKKAFAQHKKDHHYDELSTSSHGLSHTSEISASMAPPAIPRTRERVSRIAAAGKPSPRASTSRSQTTTSGSSPNSPISHQSRSTATTEEPETPKSPPAKRGRKVKFINPKNMPARIGKKKKGPNGEEVEGDWHKNPKFASG